MSTPRRDEAISEPSESGATGSEGRIVKSAVYSPPAYISASSHPTSPERGESQGRVCGPASPAGGLRATAELAAA